MEFCTMLDNRWGEWKIGFLGDGRMKMLWSFQAEIEKKIYYWFIFLKTNLFYSLLFFPLLYSSFSLQTQNVEINSLLISYRVVLEVAGNSDAVILSGLEADTQYQVTVAALWGGHKYRSRPIVFRTLGKLYYRLTI